jgi:(R,R)-butanediol dehydrogenase/meso-butanediol dehydrogenase/diacetyl reductase
MKAAIYHKPGEPLHIERRRDPTPNSDEVIIRVHRCGVCGTDLQMTSGHGQGYPCNSILGHEFAGEIVAKGRGVAQFQIGERVTSMGYAGCGTCEHCRSGNPLWCSAMRGVSGGFAEFAASPATACIKLPDALSLDDGALVEPLASALHAVRMAGIIENENIAVLGAGMIGLGVMFWSRRSGARAVTAFARSESAKQRALIVGADLFVTNADMDIMSPRIVFECTGAPGLIARAIELVQPRGTVVIAGLCLKADNFLPALAMMKEVRLLFAVGYTQAEFQYTADFLAQSAINATAAFVGDTIALNDLPVAFEALREQHSRGKLMVDLSL